jgi:hypothetical protein
VVALAALLAAGGCASAHRVLIDDPARAYPTGNALQAAVDVHVLRNNTRITFTNTTPDTLGPGTLWLNKEFSAPFEAMPPGQTRTMSLKDFTNRFGQTFRAGGFFATRTPAKLVSAELQPEGSDTMVPLLIVRGEGS